MPFCAAQLMQALRLNRLRELRQQATISAETEKTKNYFLRAISHDLRTPLTSILGASSTLVESNERLDLAIRTQLAMDIHEDAQWLINMVQNILLTTRMGADGFTVIKKMEAMEEVIANAVAGIRKRHKASRLLVKVPEELILVPMDAMLISQVLTNLLENALRHAGRDDPEVRIELTANDGQVSVTVRDDGIGLSKEAQATLFQQKPYTMVSRADASRGFGMGLSICKAIMQAHHGDIEGENQETGGAVFRIVLPMQEQVEK